MNNSAKTAIHRKDASKPLRVLWERGILWTSVLDWGCGRGGDVEWMRNHGLTAYAYDPNYFPVLDKYEDVSLITCFYVLNVIQDENERVKLVQDIYDYLPAWGKAVFAVRDDNEIYNLGAKKHWDIEGDGWVTNAGTFQKGYSTWELPYFLRHSADWKHVDVINNNPLMAMVWKGHNYG